MPLSSQLYPIAKEQSSEQFGFNSSHTEILENEEVINYILSKMRSIESNIPEYHLEAMNRGGFDVELGDKFVKTLRGELPPTGDLEKGWFRFTKEFTYLFE